MRKKERITKILEILDGEYGTQIQKYLHYNTPFQLLVAVILSAQCTDARVNIVTEELFKKYPGCEELSEASLGDIEDIIHSTGFYHAKAKNIIATARVIRDKYEGQVPSSIEDLTALPGVGRKTANVIRGNIFSDPSIVVDTHVKRLSRKLGLTRETDPEKVEKDLMRVIPKDHWIRINTQLIAHGRSICTARSPKCQDCSLALLCPSALYQGK